MIQRDVIQRMIHQISAVLARMMGKGAEEQYIILEQYCKDQHGLSPKRLDEIPDEQLLYFLTEELQMNAYQVESVAGIIKARAAIFLEQRNFKKAKTNFDRSLLLFDYVNDETATFSFDRKNMIDDIKNNLKSIK